MIVEPQQFGPDTTPHVNKGLRKIVWGSRKNHRNPFEPQVFSQAKVLIPLGLLFSFILTPILYFPISEYVSGEEESVGGIIFAGVAILMGYTFLLHGMFRRFGIDQDKVWTQFGRIFYREIRFEQVTQLREGFDQYKLYAGKTKIRIDYKRFDYTLVYYRLLEELQHRRFTLHKIEPDHPEWEAHAQMYRNQFGAAVYHSDREFFDSHPKELDRLNALVLPPNGSFGHKPLKISD